MFTLVKVSILVVFVAFGFLAFGVLLLTVVANARLSDRFRAEEFRNRLRALDLAADERPDVLPGRGRSADDAPDGEAGENGDGRA